MIDPRGVLREFGLEIGEDVEVRVWDSTAELRYLVLPERPAGTEQMSEDELAALVTRDAMIGAAKVTLAARAGAMNGVHDMGGMHGMGPIAPEADEPVFHERLGRPRFRAQPRHGRSREMEHRCGPASRSSVSRRPIICA